MSSGKTDIVTLANGKFSLSSVPPWARNWFRDKHLAALSPWTLDKYYRDVQVLKIDLSKASLSDIKERLGELKQHYADSSFRAFCVTAKQVLRDLGREAEADAIKTPKLPEHRVVNYTGEDHEQLLTSCYTFRDHLLVEVLWETGARRGELFNMRIKDIEFDQYSAIIWLHGKTGTRQRRIYDAKAELLEYLGKHPHKDDPEAKFWLSRDGRPLTYQSIYKAIHSIGVRALNRNVYPHGFRHSAATRDAKKFTDRELMIRHGWSRSETVAVYTHLSMRDVDDKDLALHGFNSSGLNQLRSCPRCHAENGPTANYCQNCGEPINHSKDGSRTELLLTEVDKRSQ